MGYEQQNVGKTEAVEMKFLWTLKRCARFRQNRNKNKMNEVNIYSVNERRDDTKEVDEPTEYVGQRQAPRLVLHYRPKGYIGIWRPFKKWV
jgi:hypothetical protein